MTSSLNGLQFVSRCSKIESRSKDAKGCRTNPDMSQISPLSMILAKPLQVLCQVLPSWKTSCGRVQCISHRRQSPCNLILTNLTTSPKDSRTIQHTTAYHHGNGDLQKQDPQPHMSQRRQTIHHIFDHNLYIPGGVS